MAPRPARADRGGAGGSREAGKEARSHVGRDTTMRYQSPGIRQMLLLSVQLIAMSCLASRPGPAPEIPWLRVHVVKDGAREYRGSTIVIRMTATGPPTISGKELGGQRLAHLLTQGAKAFTGQPVVRVSDRNCPYGAVHAAVSTVQEAGLKSVKMMVVPAEAAAAPKRKGANRLAGDCPIPPAVCRSSLAPPHAACYSVGRAGPRGPKGGQGAAGGGKGGRSQAVRRRIQA